MPVGRLLLRGTVGTLFVGHGTQKLFGWFDGHGLEETTEMMQGLGLRPPRVQALAAGLAEAGGGAGLALGLATPLPSVVLVSTMLTAVRTVHWRSGPWLVRGGWEYNAVLIAAAAAVAEGTDTDRWPGGGALWALALGAVGALGVKVIADRVPESETSRRAGTAPPPSPADAEAPATDAAS